MVCGYDPTRPVPTWDEYGRRIAHVSPFAMAAAGHAVCEVCGNTHSGRYRTCSSRCGALLRYRLKRALLRTKKTWLSFPKEEVLDGC